MISDWSLSEKMYSLFNLKIEIWLFFDGLRYELRKPRNIHVGT